MAGSFTYFAIITTIYFIIKYNVVDQKTGMIWGIVYLILLFIGLYFTNLSATKEICGSTQPGTALIVTTVPWALIFGVLILMLIAFPGWLSPFSNTFGYLFAKLAGVNKIMENILPPKMDTATTPAALKAAASSLEQIYSDKSLLVNQLTPENFDQFWTRMSQAKLLSKTASQSKEALRNIVRLKNVVAEYVWALLGGSLVTSISSSYIMNASCIKNTDELSKNHSKFVEDANAKQQAAKKVYEISQ